MILQKEGQLQYKKRSSQQVIYVIKGLKTNLLGQYCSANCHPPSLSEDQKWDPAKFLDAFNGLGNFVEEFDMKLTPDAQPFALTTPRNITLPLRPKVVQSCPGWNWWTWYSECISQHRGVRVWWLFQKVRKNQNLCRNQAVQRKCPT